MSKTLQDPESTSLDEADPSQAVSTVPSNDKHTRTPSRPKDSARLYAVVWRWHFYAGLITAPILWAVTLTGVLYVFQTELASWRDRPLLQVEPRATRLSYDALRTVAAEALGSEEIEAIRVHPEADRSVMFLAEKEGTTPEEHRHHRCFIDPYTGKVLGTRIAEDDIFAIVLELHRSLLMGSTGRILTELATSWALILFATGIYLWWPRGKKNVGVWAPRWQGKPYAVLRDWHSVIGAYLVPLMGLVAFTGLFFTLVWGTGFNTTTQKLGHWPAVWFTTPTVTPPTPEARPLPLDTLVPIFLAKSRPGDSVQIGLAEGPTKAFRSFMMSDEDKNTLRTVSVDPYSGKVLSVADPKDLRLLYRIRLWAVSIHMGKIFGLTTKLLALLASLVLLGLSFTGVWMWWIRRPKGRTGIPRRPPAQSLPRWGWLVLLVAGITMPVAGISMVLIILIDQFMLFVRRRAGWSTA